jgi:hypothetical protein
VTGSTRSARCSGSDAAQPASTIRSPSNTIGGSRGPSIDVIQPPAVAVELSGVQSRVLERALETWRPGLS